MSFLNYFLGLFKKSSKESVDLSRVISLRPRHKCPFYGFFCAKSAAAFLDQRGNQCALRVTSYTPCEMEFHKETPDWSKCPLNAEKDREIIEEMMDSYKIFPDEFGSAGLSLREWSAYVMNDKVPRPQ